MYIKPTVEVIEIENEGIMALSDISGPGIDTRGTSGNDVNNRQRSDSFQELNDLINDLLTH